MKKLLICGAAGMVGQTVISEAMHHIADYEIWASDMNVDVFSKINNPNFHAVLNNELETVMAANHFDAMLQMAFPRNVQQDQWAGGIAFCFNVLHLAQKYNVKRVVHVSSQSLYGWQRDNAADENSQVMLVSPYTTGKYCAELLTMQLFTPGTFTNVRLSTIIGPQTKERVVNKFLDRVIKGENIEIQGGNQIFSFLDVRDAATGLLSILTKENVKLRPVYNLGTCQYATLLELAHMSLKIGEKYGYSKSKLVVETADIVMNNKIMVLAVKEDFGWESKYSLVESIENIFKSLI